jgi:kynurenine formamidase
MCNASVLHKAGVCLSRRSLIKAGALAAGAAAIASSPTAGLAQNDKPKTASGSVPASPGMFQIDPLKLVDLTHTTTPDFPVFPGGRQFSSKTMSKVVPDGYYTNHWEIDEHTGTHMDAPAHFVSNGVTSDKLPIANLVAPLVLIDITVRAAKNDDAAITPDDILAWEKANGPIPQGACVVMRSGWDSRLAKPGAFLNQDAQKNMHFPGFSKEAAALLTQERSIKGIGVDTLSLDIGASHTFDAHKVILGAGLWGVENLASLAKVPATGATIIIAPIKIKNASGGPVRVYAAIP